MKKAEIKGGATLWARKTLTSEIIQKPGNWFKIWFYLVNRVNHKDTKEFKRGECFLKYEWIEDTLNVTKNEIDHCVRWLKSAKQIATHKARRGMIVKVLKYDYFQRLDNYYSDIKSDTKSDAPGDIKAKQVMFKKRNSINKNESRMSKNDKEIPRRAALVEIPHKKSEQEIMNTFYKINPTLNFANKTFWDSCTKMIKACGEQKAIEIARYSVFVQGKKFAPVITNPYQLKEKLAQLKIYYESQKGEQMIKL